MGEENRLLEELALYEEQCGGLEEQVAELSGRIKNAEFLDEMRPGRSQKNCWAWLSSKSAARSGFAAKYRGNGQPHRHRSVKC